jgi:hypothetical protein
VADGYVTPPGWPGTSLTWKTDDVAHFRRG